MRILTLSLAVLVSAVPARAQTGQDARVYELQQVEALPRPLNAAELAAALQRLYPAHLRDAGVGGTVALSFIVGVDGQPADLRVVSATDPAFGAPTVQAASLLRFTPAQVRGRPVPVRVEQSIVWQVQAAPAAAPAEHVVGAPTAADTADAFEIAAVTEMPRVISTSAFRQALRSGYPAALRSQGVSGRVMVRFMVEPDGRVTHAYIVRSTHPGFDQPSLDAVRTLRFRPARIGRRPVRVWLEQPIEWMVSP